LKNILILTKSNCKFCTQAKKYLRDKGISFKEKKVSSRKEANEASPALIPKSHKTMPVIWHGDVFVGGADQLPTYHSMLNQDSKRTVFNKNATGHITGRYPLFMGEDLGFGDTINNQYPQLEKFFQTQQSFHWNEFEVDLTEDRQNMITAPAGVRQLMVKTLLWQSLVDSAAARAVTGILLNMVSNPILEDLYNIIGYFETIHRRTYLHIIKQTFVDPNGALEEGYADLDSFKRSEALITAFDALLNLDANTSERDRRKALYKALITMYMLEALNFMASFAITFGIADAGYFQGIGQDVSFICRDEMLHAKVGKYVLQVEQKAHPDIFEELQEETEAIFHAVLQGEREWTDKLFSDGRYCPNISASRVKKYLEYAATPVAESLGIKDFTPVYENPLPYMDEYTDSSNVQVAPQELQISAYRVNSVAGIKDRARLTETLKKLAATEGFLANA
jgi:ribonucleoside-diphosphate reductase beta chain